MADLKTLITHYYEELFNKKNEAAADALHTPYFLYHDLAHPGQPLDHKSFMLRTSRFAEAFEDGVFHLDDVVVGEERVFATQTGDLPHIPKTDLPVRISIVAFYRFEDSKIAEVWELWDALSLYQELGALPQN